MRFSRRRASASVGFTLVEMLVVAPIVILVITGMIALMINMTGNVLVSQARSQQILDNQQGLSQLESDIHTAVSFPATLPMAAPFGPNNVSGTWNANSTSTITSNSSNALLISTYATSVNPRRSTNQNSLFYLNNSPNPCSSANRIYNSTYMVNVSYFIVNNTLYRRSFLPNIGANTPNATSGNAGQNICDFQDGSTIPWQQTSCANGYVGQNRCTTVDDTVATNVSSLTAKFFADASTTSPLSPGSQLSAQSVDLSLTSSTSIAGKTLTYTGNLSALSANTYMGQ